MYPVSDHERPLRGDYDDREGLGAITWTAAVIVAAILAWVLA